MSLHSTPPHARRFAALALLGLALTACQAEVKYPAPTTADRDPSTGEGMDGGTTANPCDGKDAGAPCGGGRHCVPKREGNDASLLCLVNTCGDGVRAGDEQCDDGDELASNGCSPACRVVPETCGDGKVDEGEECDDGDLLTGNACSNACTLNVCGNHRRDPGEECDDGNDDDGDYCTRSCRRTLCGNGKLDPGEVCDDGNADNHDRCTSDCRAIWCGDGITQADSPLREECDDANDVDDDACSNQCTRNECGNGRKDPGEFCDGTSCTEGAAGASGSVSLKCNDTCDACEDDVCEVCLLEQCSDYNTILLYEACLVEARPDNVWSPPPRENFTRDCTDLYRCMRFSDCADPALSLETRMVACACTEEPVPQELTRCKAEHVRGACLEPLARATGCDDAHRPEGYPMEPCIDAAKQDLTIVSGHAYFLMLCMEERCAAACGL